MAKSEPKEYHEGPQAAKRFAEALRHIVSVPCEEYEKRHKAWEKTRKNHRAKAR